MILLVISTVFCTQASFAMSAAPNKTNLPPSYENNDSNAPENKTIIFSNDIEAARNRLKVISERLHQEAIKNKDISKELTILTSLLSGSPIISAPAKEAKFKKELSKYMLEVLSYGEINATPKAQAFYFSTLAHYLEDNPKVNKAELFKMHKRAYQIFPSAKTIENLLNFLTNRLGYLDEKNQALYRSVLADAANYLNDLEKPLEYYEGNYFYAQKQYQKCIDILNKALEDPKTTSKTKILIWHKQAQAYRRLNNYKEVARLYKNLEVSAYEFTLEDFFIYAKALSVNNPDQYWKILRLYKKSEMPHGYYQAGLLYLKLGGTTNATLMAKNLKEMEDIELYNMLMDKIRVVGIMLETTNLSTEETIEVQESSSQ